MKIENAEKVRELLQLRACADEFLAMLEDKEYNNVSLSAKGKDGKVKFVYLDEDAIKGAMSAITEMIIRFEDQLEKL